MLTQHPLCHMWLIYSQQQCWRIHSHHSWVIPTRVCIYRCICAVSIKHSHLYFMFVDIPIVVSSLWSPRSTRSVSTTTLLTALSSTMLQTPARISAITTETSPTTSQSASSRVHQLSTAYSLTPLTLSASSILAHSSYPSNPVSTSSTQLSPEEHRLFTTLFSLVIGLLGLAIILTTILIIVFGMRCVKRCLAIKQENKRPVIRKFLRNNLFTDIS